MRKSISKLFKLMLSFSISLSFLSYLNVYEIQADSIQDYKYEFVYYVYDDEYEGYTIDFISPKNDEYDEEYNPKLYDIYSPESIDLFNEIYGIVPGRVDNSFDDFPEEYEYLLSGNYRNGYFVGQYISKLDGEDLELNDVVINNLNSNAILGIIKEVMSKYDGSLEQAFGSNSNSDGDVYYQIPIYVKFVPCNNKKFSLIYNKKWFMKCDELDEVFKVYKSNDHYCDGFYINSSMNTLDGSGIDFKYSYHNTGLGTTFYYPQVIYTGYENFKFTNVVFDALKVAQMTIDDSSIDLDYYDDFTEQENEILDSTTITISGENTRFGEHAKSLYHEDLYEKGTTSRENVVRTLFNTETGKTLNVNIEDGKFLINNLFTLAGEGVYINITGGYFGAIDFNEDNYTKENVKTKIKDYVADGYEIVENTGEDKATYPWKVQEKLSLFTVGDSGFDNYADAHAEAMSSDNKTIKLTQDLDLSDSEIIVGVDENSKDIIFDLNGNTLKIKNITAFGLVVDSSERSTGELDVKDNFNYTKSIKKISSSPKYQTPTIAADSADDGYKHYKFYDARVSWNFQKNKTGTKGSKKVITIGSSLVVNKEDILKSGDVRLGVHVDAKFMDGDQEKTYDIKPDFVFTKEFAKSYYENTENKVPYFKWTANGKIDSLSFNGFIKSESTLFRYDGTSRVITQAELSNTLSE